MTLHQDGALQALDLVAGLIRERGGEAAVLAALREARENHQRVMASQQRPGPVQSTTLPCPLIAFSFACRDSGDPSRAQDWVLLTPVATADELR